MTVLNKSVIFFREKDSFPLSALCAGWLEGIRGDVSAFINSFIIGRLTIVLAAYFIVRAVLDVTQGGNPLGSVLTIQYADMGM